MCKNQVTVSHLARCQSTSSHPLQFHILDLNWSSPSTACVPAHPAHPRRGNSGHLALLLLGALEKPRRRPLFLAGVRMDRLNRLLAKRAPARQQRRLLKGVLAEIHSAAVEDPKRDVSLIYVFTSALRIFEVNCTHGCAWCLRCYKFTLTHA